MPIDTNTDSHDAQPTENDENGENTSTEDGSPDANPGVEPEDRGHSNPIDAADVNDEERAQMLRDYLNAFAAEFGQEPKLMPLDAEGKAPIIKGRCGLDTRAADRWLVYGREAVRRIRENGARGFAIYADKPHHGTEDVVFVDHDDTEAFPAPTAEPTLEVLSGSGRGVHETYHNAGNVKNAKVGDNKGEVRALNWYVAAPGTIHPTGGVYHVIEEREIATLADADLVDRMRPNSGQRPDSDGSATSASTQSPRPAPRYESADDPPTAETVADANPWIREYLQYGAEDRSTKDYAVCRTMAEYGVPEPDVHDLLNDKDKTKVYERDWDYWRDTWRPAVRDADVNSKEIGDSKGEPVAVLPPTVRDLSTAHSGRVDDDTLTLNDIRERTTDAFVDAYKRGDHVLIAALPGAGKTYGAIKAAWLTGRDISIFVPRGNKEMYDEIADVCEEHRLDYLILPSFFRDCPSATGDHGEEIERKLQRLYQNGATPAELHDQLDLPCECGEGHSCPYRDRWGEDLDDYDVLIGNPQHAYVPTVTMGRTAVFDEFCGGAFEVELDGRLAPAVSAWLDARDVPFDDYTDLLEYRDDDERKADTLDWFEQHGVSEDSALVFEDDDAHAAAPLAVYTLLTADDMDNGVERTVLGDGGLDAPTGVYDREEGKVTILRPPDLNYASGVVALDGTPTPELWNLALGTELNYRQLLTDEERKEYITDALNLSLVQTTEYVKPYNSESHVAVDKDAALLDAIHENHDEKPGLITTKTAEDVYDNAGVLEHVDETKHYGNVLGSGDFEDKRLGVVTGDNHYGDQYVKKWAAYAGHTAERGDGCGADLSYGAFGDDVLTHMREHDTLQGAMRFGRDGNGATVYVHTNTLPEWVPLAGEGRVIETRSDGERDVVAALADLDTATTAEIAEYSGVEIGERQVRNILTDFAERGYIEREVDGDGYVWRDDGLHRVNDHGDVELDSVALNDLGDDETAELGRTSIYTWEFRSSTRDPLPTVVAPDAREAGPPGQTSLAAFGPPPPG